MWEIPSLIKYTTETLKKAKPDEQREVMEYWFGNKFEDPVHNCPFNDGEYIYIYGGPYDAQDELEKEFIGIIPDEIINKYAGELEQECYLWSGKPTEEWYDDIYLEAIQSDKDSYNSFIKSKEKLKSLLDTTVNDSVEQDFLRLIYINLITILETYLADCFINAVLQNEYLLRKFVKGYDDFKNKKFSLNDVFEKIDSIKEEAKIELLKITWHNLEKVKSIYKYTFDVEFTDTKEIFQAIRKRHDFVHRNGKTKEGIDIFIKKQEIHRLLDKISELVEDINKKIRPDF